MAKKKTILIVDDEPNLVELIKEVLEEKGYDVICAENGVVALKVLESVKPNLIILDMMMPYMTGLEVLAKIRQNPLTSKLKVIFLSVVTEEEVDNQELKKLDVKAYLPKPFDLNTLIKTVKKYA